MGSYQKFRGDPENKLFYILNGFMGGINTEFSDDASSDVDFESIINFDVDKFGTLNKRNGFGENKALGEIFLKGFYYNYPHIYNKTEENLHLENDNLVYVKLLQDDNNCFRNLSGFKSYKDYQRQFGFQNNVFKLLMITTKGDYTYAWYLYCRLPELSDDGTDTIECYSYNVYFPDKFNWNNNLTNMDSIEFYSDIWFTNNANGLIRFDRNKEIKSRLDLLDAFHFYYGDERGYGLVGEERVITKSNEAYKPSLVELTEASFGPNALCTNPLYDLKIDTSLEEDGIESLQGAFLTTSDLRPISKKIPVNEPLLIFILYTGSSTFNISAKSGETDLKITVTENQDLSRPHIKVLNLVFENTPNGEVEIKIEKQGTQVLKPYYMFVEPGQLDPGLTPIEHLNIGDCGMCMMSDNRVAYYKEDVIFFSDVNIPDYITFNNYLKLPLEPTDRITKMCYFKGVYIVFTKERIYKLMGNWGSSDFSCEPVSMSLGCHAGNTVVPIEDMLYFMSPRGLYALKSSTFIESMQNLKELDIKVKRLTSDFTRYDPEYESLTYRYNGVSENAYAIRYKDKYMLFYNNYGNDKNWASENDIDVLVYQYDINAFTTYRFAEKPTFLTNIGGNIEVFAISKVFNPTENTERLEDLIPSLSDNEGELVFDGTNHIIKYSNINYNSDYGFDLEFEGSFENTEYAKVFELSNKTGQAISVLIKNGKIGIEVKKSDKDIKTLYASVADMGENHLYNLWCRADSANTGYNLAINVDGENLDNIWIEEDRLNNVLFTQYIVGKYLKGTVKNFVFSALMDTYDSVLSVFELGTSSTDFGKPIHIELETKSINMQYPQHIKKLKNIFVKMIGGYKYNDFFFELYGDGYLVNNPKKYYVELDHLGTVIYDYTLEKTLEVDEITSILGKFRLSETRLGEGIYQTKKLVIPSKAKNFRCKIYGESSDYLSFESFGFVCKLGKVKES